MSALHYLKIADLLRLIGSGELSPVEATQAHLDRIAMHEPMLHS